MRKKKAKKKVDRSLVMYKTDYEKIGVKDAFRKSDLWASYVASSKVRKLCMNYCTNFKDSLEDGLGLFLYGDFSSGKSLLANLCATHLHLRKHKVFVTDVSEVMEVYAGRWRRDENAIDFFEHIKTVDLLVMDDIGKTNNNEGVRECIDAVLRYRAQHLLPVIYTSNNQLGEVVDVYGEAIGSLIERTTKLITCPASNYVSSSTRSKNKRFQDD